MNTAPRSQQDLSGGDPAERLVITEKALAKHTNNIFGKLGLQPSAQDNVRVLAVLTYLQGQ